MRCSCCGEAGVVWLIFGCDVNARSEKCGGSCGGSDGSDDGGGNDSGGNDGGGNDCGGVW